MCGQVSETDIGKVLQPIEFMLTMRVQLVWNLHSIYIVFKGIKNFWLTQVTEYIRVIIIIGQRDNGDDPLNPK